MMARTTMSKSTRCKVALGVICFYAVATLVARRRGYSGMGGRTLVQCRQGHLFRTIWVPGVSIKALRLGWYRAQFCPVGRHWTLVKPVRDRDVEGRDEALEVIPEDIAIP